MINTGTDRPPAVTELRGTGEPGGIVLDWTPVSWEVVVDHYAVYAAENADDVEIEPSTLLTKTVFPHADHDGLGGQARRWVYRVVTVDASGARSEPSAPVTVTSQA